VGRHGGHPSSRISKGATAPIAHLAFIRLGGLTLALPGTRFAAPFEPFAMRFPATTATWFGCIVSNPSHMFTSTIVEVKVCDTAARDYGDWGLLGVARGCFFALWPGDDARSLRFYQSDSARLMILRLACGK
jgi:hypothetical protein